MKRAIVTVAFICAILWPALSAASSIGIIVVASASDAEKIAARLKTGADFEAIAREVSIDSTAHDGGHLRVEPEDLLVPLRTALAQIEPGAISAIVKIPEGFAILTRFKESAPRSPLGPPPNGKLTLSISGYTEFYQVFKNRAPEDPAALRAWAMDLKGVCAAREGAPQDAMATLRNQLKAPETLEPLKLAYTHYTLGELSSAMGDFKTSINEWETVYKDALASGNSELAQHMETVLGVGYLHRASAGDHGSKPPIDIGLIFPSHPGSANVVIADVEKSIEHLTKALKLDPPNLELKWLLNLAYMEEGTYPAKVPPEFVIPPPVFLSQEDLGRFTDVGPATGLNVYGTAGGVIVDDFDGDGLLDVVTSQVDDCAPLHFFHNNGDGTFTNRAKEAGLIDQTGGLNIIQADYNNDGCVDILVMRGGWEMARRRSLLKNNCDGTFTDVTKQSGLLEGPLLPSQSAVWLDIDNDGNLDLFITNENAPGQLFLNKGDGTFVDISREAGVDIAVFGKAVVTGDYDNDGYPDIYISSFNGPNVLFHNNGNKTFTNVTERAGLGPPWMSFAAWFFDYDNDGWPDIFVTGYFFSVDEVVRSYLGMPHQGETLKLFRNMHDGTFKDVTEQVGLDRIFMPMGANFGDIDNDGFLDMYLGMGNPSYTTLMPNTLLHNKNGERFVDITASSGTGAFSKGHGVAFADLNNDGDEDIFVVMGGPSLGDRYNARLFQNPGAHGNDWITLKLNGVKTNRGATGARIAVAVTNEGHRRTIYRTVGSGGSFGASPLQQHIGLGKSAKIELIEVYWPASKTKQIFTNVKPNQFLEIKEFEKAPLPLARKSFRLGGS